MEEHQNDLPAAFRQAFAAGQAAIAQAQAPEDGQQLLLTVHKHQRRLLELAPALVGQCEMQACTVEEAVDAMIVVPQIFYTIIVNTVNSL
jgi:hypothetical protein